MGKIKNVFTMALLYFIKNLLNFSSRLLPVFIAILSLLKLSKVLINLNWHLVLAVLILEAVLLIAALFFDSVFFKNKKASYNSSSNNNEQSQDTSIESQKFPVLNVAVIFFAFLGIIFVILKLFNAVDWNWIWVLSPLWLSTALVLFILFICLVFFIISLFINNKKDKYNRDNKENEENKEKTTVVQESSSSESENNNSSNKAE